MKKEELRTAWLNTVTIDEFATGDPSRTYRAQSDGGNKADRSRSEGAATDEQNLQEKLLDDSAISDRSRYRLLEEIGRGGMGVVYRADQGSLGREVAIKTLLASSAKRHSLRRFVSEAQLTGLLDHPNIVPVYDLELTKTGELHLAMKLLTGIEWKHLLHPKTDQDRSRAAEYGLSDHIKILITVCNAMAFAHERGIAHCDLKPENVMIGQFGEVFVMDWGIAVDITPIDQRKPNMVRIEHHTEVSVPRGTPRYMPPELARGDGARISAKTDVYLLGAILYELLEGLPPHQGATMTEVLTHLSSEDPIAFESDAAQELQTICRCALNKEANDRYPTVSAFRSALESYLESRESRLITRSARELLERCQQGQRVGELDKGALSQLYADFSESAAGFSQALLLWPENRDAAEGAEEARYAYARAALAHGDLGLAEAQVLKLDQDHLETKELRLRIIAARQQRRDLESASRKLRVVAVVAVGVILLGLTVGLVLVSSARAKTEEARQEAVALGVKEHRAMELAEQRLADVNRLADVKRLENLEKQATWLWPAYSKTIPAYQLWLSEAEDLLEHRTLHQDTLVRFRAGEGVFEKNGLWIFPTVEEQWMHDTLAELIQKLMLFANQTIRNVDDRLVFAQTIRQRSIVKYEPEWKSTSRALSQSVVYGGLEIEPLEGFVPLGQDPDSGLFEFSDLQSGAVPTRDERGRLQINENTGLVFVLIPEGEFLMGAIRPSATNPLGQSNVDPFAEADEQPITRIRLDPFLISKFEVTQAQWERQMSSAPSQYGPLIEAGRRHPVTNVNFEDVSTFTFQLGLTLPTEAQWEYSARAGSGSTWWTGDERESLKGRANLADSGYEKQILGRPGAEDWNDGHTLHAPIGNFPANQFGLHDVAGNVWEWCLDHYGSYEIEPSPGTGLRRVAMPTTRVMRGGGWDNDALWQRSALRHKVPPEARWSGLGLRPVKRLVLEKNGRRGIEWSAPPESVVESIDSEAQPTSESKP